MQCTNREQPDSPSLLSQLAFTFVKLCSWFDLEVLRVCSLQVALQSRGLLNCLSLPKELLLFCGSSEDPRPQSRRPCDSCQSSLCNHPSWFQCTHHRCEDRKLKKQVRGTLSRKFALCCPNHQRQLNCCCLDWIWRKRFCLSDQVPMRALS